MTEAILQTAEEQITCSICFDLFEEPKALPCLHTFCKKCITDHIVQHSHVQSNSRGYRCPVCRRFVPAPPNAQSQPSSWSESLEGNHMIVSLMEAYKTPRVKSQFACPEHDGNDVELYCVDHKLFICSVCALQHRKCNDVRTRDDAMSSLKISEIENNQSSENKEAEHLIKMLFEQCNSIENLIADRKSKLLHIDREEAHIINEVAKQKRLVIEMLNCQEENIKTKLAKRKAKEVKRLETEMRKCDKIADRTKSSLTKLQRAIECQGQTSDDLRKTMASVRKDHESCRKKIIASSQKALFTGFNYKSSNTLEQFIQNFDAFGHFEALSNDCDNPGSNRTDEAPRDSLVDHNNCRQTPSGVHEAAVPRPIPRPRSRAASSQRRRESRDNRDVIRVREAIPVTVNFGKQKPCWITGIAILQNGDVLLVDSHNERIMLFDSDSNLLSHVKVTPPPYDVTLISDTDIMVTRPNANDGLLSCLIRDSTIELGGTLETTIQPYSVHYDSGILVVCSNDEMQLYEKDDAIWTPTYSQSFYRAKITYAAVDGRNQKIFLTDQKYPDPQLLCVAFSGDIIWRFVHKDLNFPTGLSIYGNFVFVASWDQCAVLQLTRDGRYLGTVLHEGIQYPWKLAVGPNGGKLVTSQYKNSLGSDDKKVVKIFLVDTDI